MAWKSWLPTSLRLQVDRLGLGVGAVRDGLLLPERAVARCGRELQVPRDQEAPAAARVRELELLELRRETADAVSLVFANSPSDPLRFRPGQYLMLLLELDGQQLRRPYSFSSDPGKPEQLQVTVKRVPGGLVSNHIHDQLRPGARLRTLGPCGDFGLQPEPGARRHLVLIGGGSGVTPLMSMLLAFSRVESGSAITFLDANRDTESIIFADRLRSLARNLPRCTVHHVLETLPEGFQGSQGRLDDALLARLLPCDGPEVQYFLCGPPPMMDAVQGCLDRRGVPRSRVHLERFFASPRAAHEEARPGLCHQVEFRASAVTLQVPEQQTLLEAGLAAGLALPYSCSVGGCASCKVRLVSGTLSMPEPHALSPAETAQGFRLMCIARARSDVVLDV